MGEAIGAAKRYPDSILQKCCTSTWHTKCGIKWTSKVTNSLKRPHNISHLAIGARGASLDIPPTSYTRLDTEQSQATHGRRCLTCSRLLTPAPSMHRGQVYLPSQAVRGIVAIVSPPQASRTQAMPMRACNIMAHHMSASAIRHPPISSSMHYELAGYHKVFTSASCMPDL